MNRRKIPSSMALAAAGLFSALLLLPTIPVLAQIQTAWVARYNEPAGGYDGATALAVDDSGNVYVTGSSGGDYATIKYAPNGDTLWVRRYPGGASALALDGSGNVYVTGSSGGDYATIKYAPNGDTLWVRRYNGPGNGSDNALALAVDYSGNVYVTGVSYDYTTGFSDYATIKYAPNGDTLWVRRYDGSGTSDDRATALAVDAAGNVYVTGSSGLDYATIKYAPNGDTLWVRKYENGYEATALAVDGSGNVYVTGPSRTFCGFGCWQNDAVTIKYAPNGDTLWVRRYSGENLAVDGSGNVYVTGAGYATFKYAPNGDSLWVRYYANNYSNEASAIAVDESGNVFVTGISGSITCNDCGPSTCCGFYDGDYATLKYAPNGVSLWAGRYNGPANGLDRASSLAIDVSGNVYVTGSSEGDYATIKYSPLAAIKGDLDWDRNLTAADVVLMLNCVFLGTGNCAPSFTDVNCSGDLTPADVVLELYAVFLTSPFPCS